MLLQKREHPKLKSGLHPRNKHRERYDFKQLIDSCQELAQFVKLNIYNDESIDFSDPGAVKMLNKSLLKHDYNIGYWDIPVGYLCPPVPGRADYLHHMADLVCGKNFGKIPTGSKIKCLDIGVGANCIYPVIGNREYGWSFIGSDIDPVAIESAGKILEMNPLLKDTVELRIQHQPNDIFFGIIQKEELIDLVICNPPFHSSQAEAQSGTLRKVENLTGEKIIEPILNFGGMNTELWCKGGEQRFIRDMIRQSKFFRSSCFWFSTLVSKQSHLRSIYEALKTAEALEVKTIPVGQGNKSGRIVAWTYLNREQQENWRITRWKEEKSA